MFSVFWKQRPSYYYFQGVYPLGFSRLAYVNDAVSDNPSMWRMHNWSTASWKLFAYSQISLLFLCALLTLFVFKAFHISVLICSRKYVASCTLINLLWQLVESSTSSNISGILNLHLLLLFRNPFVVLPSIWINFYWTSILLSFAPLCRLWISKLLMPTGSKLLELRFKTCHDARLFGRYVPFIILAILSVWM